MHIFNDLAIGIPDEDLRATIFTKTDAGAVQLLYGSFGGLYVPHSTTTFSSFISEEKFVFVHDAITPGPLEGNASAALSSGDRFGRTLSVLDYSRGYPYLVIGTPGENKTGAIYMLPGGIWRVYKLRQGTSSSVPPGRPEKYDNFGSALP